jgi:hypothetical protein
MTNRIRPVLLAVLLGSPGAGGEILTAGATPWAERVGGTRVAIGGGAIRAAWLEEPRFDYAHGVFGPVPESGTLAVLDAGGTVHREVLPRGEVFEDLEPRLVRLDDGLEAVWTIVSHTRLGAAPVLYALHGGALVEVARGEPIGTRHRWLNPVGVADLDGDGRIELAWIMTPHLGGILHVARLEGRRLRTVARLRGVTNHLFGAPELGLAAIVPGAPPLIAAPTQDRATLLLVRFDDGALSIERRVPLPGRQCGDLHVAGRDLLLGLCDGTIWEHRLGAPE